MLAVWWIGVLVVGLHGHRHLSPLPAWFGLAWVGKLQPPTPSTNKPPTPNPPNTSPSPFPSPPSPAPPPNTHSYAEAVEGVVHVRVQRVSAVQRHGGQARQAVQVGSGGGQLRRLRHADAQAEHALVGCGGGGGVGGWGGGVGGGVVVGLVVG